MFEVGLKTFLRAAGTSAGERFYPRRLPQGAVLPAGVFFEASAGISYVSGGQSGLQTPRYQIDCWGGGVDGYLDAKTLANELVTLMSGYAGPMGDEYVTAVFIEDVRDDDDSDTERSRIILEVTIHHR